MTKFPALIALGLVAPALADPSGDEAAILALMRDACEAYENGDADYLYGFLDERYTLTNTRGEVTTKEQDLAEVRSRNPRYDEFDNHDMDVRLYGDTAVVNGITSLRGTYDGEPFELDVQFTDTFVKRDGRWKLAASHASRIER